MSPSWYKRTCSANSAYRARGKQDRIRPIAYPGEGATNVRAPTPVRGMPCLTILLLETHIRVLTALSVERPLDLSEMLALRDSRGLRGMAKRRERRNRSGNAVFSQGSEGSMVKGLSRCFAGACGLKLACQGG